MTSTELVVAAPAGLVVRRTRDVAVADGPFRSADADADATTLITYEPGSARVDGAPLLTIALVAPPATILALIAGFAWQSGHYVIAVIAFVFFAALLRVLQNTPIPKRKRPSPELTITPSTVSLPDGKHLSLADVRKVDVVSQTGGHDVRVTTPDGLLVVASPRVESHARYIADEIRTAYRTFLRKANA